MVASRRSRGGAKKPAGESASAPKKPEGEDSKMVESVKEESVESSRSVSVESKDELSSIRVSFDSLSSELNMDAATADHAWNSFKDIRVHYTLEVKRFVREIIEIKGGIYLKVDREKLLKR